MDILTQILQMTVFFGSLYGFFAVAHFASETLRDWMDARAK